MSNRVYNSMVIKPLKECRDIPMIGALSDFGYGLFVWNYMENVCYVNRFMIENFNIDFEKVTSLNEYLSEKVDDNSLFRFLDKIYQVRADDSLSTVDFPVRSKSRVVWYELELKYIADKDITVGLLSAIDSSERLKYQTEEIGDLYKAALYQLNVPVSLLNSKKSIVFTNFDVSVPVKEVYKLIEKLSEEESEKITDDTISVQLLEKSIHDTKYSVKYVIRNSVKEEMICRNTVKYGSEEHILLSHHQAVDSTTEQIRLRKILRANELMMEIKDIIDHIDDLNEMFNYLLSKIQTVIPEVNRSCILRLNEDEALYLDSSYGFNDDYVEEFVLPYKKSFAYMHLQNDYSKSVIINDIQKKYSDLFPDIKGDETRFSIQSNITSPLIVDGNLYGIISVDSDQNRVFDDVDLNLLDYMKVQTERAIEKYRQISIIKKDSTEDSLTGVSNRRHLLEVLESYKEKAKIEKKTFKFVVFDIDKLKTINDTYGHNCGDQVIKQFAFVVQSNIRDTDFIARIGGDEFVGLFYDITDEILLNRITTWTNYFNNNPVEFRENTVNTKFSFGISTYPVEGVFFSELMEVADERLYEQKEEKRKM